MLTFALDNDFGYDDGMICGGQMDVAVSVLSPSSNVDTIRKAIERLHAGETATLPLRVATPAGPVEYRVHVASSPSLVIAGGGHIAAALARLMVPLGFRVSVVDDRGAYANKERFPPPIETTVGDIPETLAHWPVDHNTYIVIVTRGHRHDEQALRAVLTAPAKYIGMIGSRRKVDLIFDDLLNAGATGAQLERVRAPIGLEIGAVTAEEIALSIAAELTSLRRADHPNVVEGPIPLSGSKA